MSDLEETRPGGSVEVHGFSSGPLRFRTAAPLLVAVAAFLCYANTLTNGYVYDSIEIVAQNPMVHDPGRWLDLWTVDYWHQEAGRTAHRDLLYRPVALLSYRLVAAIAGPGPGVQHLVNVLLHVTNALLVLALVGGLLDSCSSIPQRSPLERTRGSACWRTAFAAGLLFGVLPIHTEVVNDIVGRTDLLATAGVLMACLAFRRFLDSDGTKSSAFWFAFTGLVAFGAMCAKEIGVAVFVLVPLFDWYWRRLHVLEPREPNPEPRVSARTELNTPNSTAKPMTHDPITRRASKRSPIYPIICMGVPASFYVVLRYHALGGRLVQQAAATKTINVLVDAPVWQRALGVFQAWGMYWQKTFWPAVLSPDYSINSVHLATGVLDRDVLFGMVILTVLVFTAVMSWRQGNRAVVLLVVALGICYAPASNAVVLTQAFFAERIWYLPSVFVSILLAVTVTPLLSKPIRWMPFSLILVAMFARCWIRNPEWRSNRTLAAAAHRDHPDAIATLVVYGAVLSREGRFAEAIPMLERAVQIDSGFTVAHRALARAYEASGNYEQSLEHWRIAEMQFPGHPKSSAALASLVDRMTADALPELNALKAAADREPRDVRAELPYMRALVRLGRHEEAVARCERLGQRFVKEAAWHRECASALLYAGRSEAAIDRYRRCTALGPADPGPYVELAALLLERQQDGDLVEANRLVTRALGLSPADRNARVLKAELLALSGQLDEARTMYREVLAETPEDNPQRKLWESRAELLGGRRK